MWFQDFQDGRPGSHVGYWNRMILAFLHSSRTDASHHVSAQYDLWFGRSRLKNLKMATMVAILDIGTEQF